MSQAQLKSVGYQIHYREQSSKDAELQNFQLGLSFSRI